MLPAFLSTMLVQKSRYEISQSLTNFEIKVILDYIFWMEQLPLRCLPASSSAEALEWAVIPPPRAADSS